MKTKLLIITVIIATVLASLFAVDQYYLSYQDKEIKKSDWVQNCSPLRPNQVIPSIGLYNHTHSFDLSTCTWNPTDHGAPGFLESFYTSFLEPVFFDVANSLEVKYAYADCVATIIPQPCFDAFMGSTEPMTQKSIMENFARYLEANYPDWQISDRKWDDFDKKLNLPAIICTEFVADGRTQYMMAKWVDPFRISSFENHRNDWMCNTWLPPVDDGVKIRWNKPTFLPNDIGVVTVITKGMNQDNAKLDSFVIHVWSDVDHTGIQTTVTETDVDSGVFEATIFFAPEGKSNGTRLLVEDAVYAEYEFSINSARINNGNDSVNYVDLVNSNASVNLGCSDIGLSSKESCELQRAQFLGVVGIVIVALIGVLIVLFNRKKK